MQRCEEAAGLCFFWLQCAEPDIVKEMNRQSHCPSVVFQQQIVIVIVVGGS